MADIFTFCHKDKKRGGHILLLSNISGSVVFGKADKFEMMLPSTKDFGEKDLCRDMSDEIKKVEQ